MSVLNSIADEISPDLPGIPWEELEQRFGVPREELVLHVGADAASSGFTAYTSILHDTYMRMSSLLEQCILSFQVQDNPATSENERVLAAKALASVEKDMEDAGSRILSALQANIEVLSGSQAVNLEQEKFRAVISASQISCLYGVLSHVRGAMQLAQVAPEDIVDSADDLCKTMNGIIKLWDFGALNTLKREASPVGAAPVAIIVVIAATMAAAIVAWCVVAVTKQLEVNRQMKLICEDAVKRQDKHALAVCEELLKVNSVATGGADGPFGWMETIGKAALFLGIGYVLLKVAGPVSDMLSKKGKS
jgi:hypothetical protein